MLNSDLIQKNFFCVPFPKNIYIYIFISIILFLYFRKSIEKKNFRRILFFTFLIKSFILFQTIINSLHSESEIYLCPSFEIFA